VTYDGRPTSLAGRRARRLGRLCGLAVVAIMTASLAFSWYCGPALSQVVEGAPVRHITVTLNKSKTLRFSEPFSSAVIGAPDIADILPMTEETLYVLGKKVGTTNISVFAADKHLIAVVDLEVALDAASLRSKIVATTGAQNIRVTSANGQVILTGEASDAVSATRAVGLARGLSGAQGGGQSGGDAGGQAGGPAGGQAGGQVPVIDALKVAASQQVMLKVRFLEVDRTAQRDLGVNWFGGNKNGIGVSGLGAVSSSPTATAGSITGISPTGTQSTAGVATQTIGVNNPTITNSATSGTQLTGTVAPLLSGLFPGGAATAQPFGALLASVINTNGLRIDTLISALEDQGLVKTLAEPNLISQSGQRAQFFAGAQIPIPTVQPGSVAGTTPTVTVNYYPCGVTLGFEPTVLNTGLINLHLTPQVCQVATTTPVVVNGTTIPELTTRSADTDVELRDGQSFAIAGLLQAQDVNDLSQLPWLGNVPVLGALFRSTNYQKAETDLVVIVSVHLVRPAAPGTHLATPFDTTLPANDVDLFLMGQTERKKKYTEFVTSGGGMQGPYGHVLEAK
jgi:pilus assembly protein CpaC